MYGNIKDLEDKMNGGVIPIIIFQAIYDTKIYMWESIEAWKVKLMPNKYDNI